jgi:hypothetical protein
MPPGTAKVIRCTVEHKAIAYPVELIIAATQTLLSAYE